VVLVGGGFIVELMAIVEECRALQRILAAQVARYPRMEIQDLYKLVHQAALGCEHAVQNEQQARDWLEREVSTLADGPLESVIDPISPNAHIVRVNLRPYLAQGYDLGVLLEAFIKTANRYHGSLRELQRYGMYAEQLSRMGVLSFTPEDVRDFISARMVEDFPAVHHSAVYTEAYHPAYRVIAVAYIDGLVS